MANFINPRKTFPICDAVIYGPRILETVLTPIPDGHTKAPPGTAADHMREIFKQLDEVLADVSLDKRSVVAVSLYLEHVNRDIGIVNEVYKEYFGTHSPSRCGVGVDLQADMLVEAVFRVEMPE